MLSNKKHYTETVIQTPCLSFYQNNIAYICAEFVNKFIQNVFIKTWIVLRNKDFISFMLIHFVMYLYRTRMNRFQLIKV